MIYLTSATRQQNSLSIIYNQIHNIGVIILFVDRSVVSFLSVIIPLKIVGYRGPDSNLRDFISFNAGFSDATILPLDALRRPMPTLRVVVQPNITGVCLASRCVKGFLSLNFLAFTRVLPDVTASNLDVYKLKF